MNFAKTIFKYKRSRIWFIVSVAVITLFIIVGILAETVLFELLGPVLGKRQTKNFGGGTYYVSDYEDKEDAFKKSNLINEKINEEGITMLKNENNTLPLKAGSKISVFGKNSVNLAYGGSGSGAFTVTKDTPTIFDSLTAAGFTYNDTLRKFYESNASGKGRAAPPALVGGRSTIPGFGTGETQYSSYTEDVKNSYSKFNDAAIIVLSRIGGESFDLPRTMIDIDGAFDKKDHYLELDKNEQDLLVAVCEKFEKVIIIINSSTMMELGFLDAVPDNDSTLVAGMSDIDKSIDGALWIGGPGYSGIMALGRVLKGDINPSGRTIDTYQRDFTVDPTYMNFADNLVNNGNMYLISDGSSPSVTEHYVDYEESIYVGYRYYETRALKDGEAWYKNNVVYPFGYGLSYTSFGWKITDASFAEGASLSWTGAADKNFSVTVNVKNTGSRAGKDVVQVYITAPYTPGKIEKSHVTLVGFAKTPLLAPGADKNVTISFCGYDFASYDYADANENGFAGYELDAGRYEVRIMKNSHEQIAGRSFNLSAGVKYEKDPVTGTAVVNRYDNVSFEEKYGFESLLSRNDWASTFPVNEVLGGSNAERTITPEFLAKIKSTETNNPIDKDTTVIKPDQATVASPAGTMQLWELIKFDADEQVLRDPEGTILVDFDDPRWEEHINLLTVSEMMNFTMNGAFQTSALQSIGVIPALSTDGPVGFVYFMSAIGSTNPVYRTCSYASECVIAATWNVELAYEMGKSVGNEGVVGNERGDGRPYSGWYAPAINIHRSPFSGRNFEYYSEDPFISGKLAAEVVKGARSRGVYCQIKHFAVNDQETNRSGVCTWLSEQTLREIYLKPFEIAVKEGGAMGMMSSFNRIGSLWAGGDYRLLTEVLRNEWGFRGMVITDFNTEPFMDTRQMAYAGGDLNLATLPKPWSVSKPSDSVVLRNSVKNILYATARSNGMNGCGEGGYYITYYAWWELLIFYFDLGLIAASGVWGFFAIRSALKKAKSAG